MRWRYSSRSPVSSLRTEDRRGIVRGRSVTQLVLGRTGLCSLVFPSCGACSLELRYVSDVVDGCSRRGGLCLPHHPGI